MGHARQRLVQRLQHRLPARPVERPQRRDVVIQHALAQHLRDRRLGRQHGREVLVLAFAGDARDQGGRCDHVADAQPRAEELAERRHRDHPRVAQLAQRRLVGATVAQRAVGHILDDPETMLFGQRHDRPPVRRRRGDAGRVLKIRHQIDERRRLAGDLGGEACQIDAVVAERNADHARATAAKRRDGAVVARLLGEHRIARAHQHRRHQVLQLERAVAHQDFVGLHAVAFGEQRAQWRISLLLAVLQDDRRIASDGRRQRLGQRCGGKRLGRRDAAGETDHLMHQRDSSRGTMGAPRAVRQAVAGASGQQARRHQQFGMQDGAAGGATDGVVRQDDQPRSAGRRG